ncbi:hypothetical protein C7405_12360 [Paraburkholderia caballeronis]|uniref:hypothetical protein n=1 Tax=Paraburkholderia caballeronis TaxID=416943 RepID=UPI00106664F9|nr:hypothetical protein [Paraburkholderia caballeronis]TDV25388.1 hypothetical protein C7405_12360 [Paraburkholderia caballeronis]
MTKPHPKKHHIKHAGTTNGNADSLVKVVVTNDKGEWIRPGAGDKFYIDESAAFPEITFEIKTNSPPPYDWEWKIEWNAHVSGLVERVRSGRKLKTFAEIGKFSSDTKLWQADLNRKVVGGKLTVSVKAGDDDFKRTVIILGKNPSNEEVTEFLNTLHNVTGMDKLIEQESKFKNFINADEEPIVAGDSGYGMTQLTTPAPSFTQIWSWKENVRGAAHLFQQKQAAAKTYLGQSGRHYTDEQLAMETISRWNGGGYHTWNGQAWERNPTMLCDSKTGNMGWDTSIAANQGKSEDELHARDKEQYSQMKPGQNAEHPWKYSGVCYADHVASH